MAIFSCKKTGKLSVGFRSMKSKGRANVELKMEDMSGNLQCATHSKEIESDRDSVLETAGEAYVKCRVSHKMLGPTKSLVIQAREFSLCLKNSKEPWWFEQKFWGQCWKRRKF